MSPRPHKGQRIDWISGKPVAVLDRVGRVSPWARPRSIAINASWGKAIGTRDPTATMARTEPDGMGNPPFRTWAEAHPQVSVGSFADAAAAGELIVNATSGAGSLPSLTAAGEHNLAGKVLLDVANPLDFSAGMPPTLFVKDSDSLGEQIQRAFPQAKVVKALNTMNALVMVHPDRVPGDHSVFVAGDHADAKQTIMDLLHGFGWSAENIVDLGGIRSARGVEMYLPLWLSLWQVLGTGDFNINVVRA